jgi:pristinamycin I synthase-3/4
VPNASLIHPDSATAPACDIHAKASETFDSALPRLFERQALATPDAPAVTCGEESLTYRDLMERAVRVSDWLSNHGIGNEDIVGVALPRSADLIACLMGVLQSGAAYLPIDTSYPVTRIKAMLDDAGVSTVLTGTHSSDFWPARLQLVDVSDPEFIASVDAARKWNPVHHRCVIHPRSSAYLMYTSGSTGNPKGIAIDHGALAHFVQAIGQSFRPGSGSRHLALTTFAFDISILELLAPLCTGAEIVIASQEEAGDPLRLAALIRANRPTSIQATPSHWSAVTEETPGMLQDCTILVGGEPLTRELAQRLHGEGAEVLNLYGPTEATIWASVHKVGQGDIAAAAPNIVTIGRPLPGYEFYVLDSALRPVSPGETGELFIGGEALARGYWRRPDLTAERFVANPFRTGGARMYRTGDLSRLLPDGNMEFLGRTDLQVKVRGFRIELGEIEAALRSSELVRDAAATVQAGGSQLIAYVVRRSSLKDDTSVSQVQAWQQVWDNTYQDGDRQPGNFNTTGWQNSYTRQAMSVADMREWVDQTVARIRSLHAGRVLEIGCGTGLLLTRLAPECASYTGIDFSPAALSGLADHLKNRDDLKHVELRHGMAQDLSFLADASVDLVILNSVIQYFPSVDYLLTVLREAIRVTAAGGHIFIGDVRSLPLLDAYHTAIQLHAASPGTPLAELRYRIRRARGAEKELVLDPALFEQLARDFQGLESFEILLKAGSLRNELNEFRYDAVATVGCRKQILIEPTRWIEWDAERRWKGELGDLMTQGAGTAGVRNIPDSRTAESVGKVRLLGNLPEGRVEQLDRAEAKVTGQESDELVRYADALGARLFLRRFNSDGTFEAVFNPRWEQAGEQPEISLAYYRRFGNAPADNAGKRSIGPELQEYLRRKLPPHMIPALIAELEEFPKTPNGKLDRRLLPQPELADESGRAPRSAQEQTICALFASVLGLRSAGIDLNFFEAGGDSLSAAHLAHRVREMFGRNIGIRNLFEAPTAAELSAHLDATPEAGVFRHVVALRKTGSEPPLFCLPPIYGLGYAYTGMARELRSQRPIYCLQASGIGRGSRLETAEGLAEQHREFIQQIQPEGPYHLLGWSFGGILAYAIACSLQRQGHRIASLTILDAYPLTEKTANRFQTRFGTGLAKIREHLEEDLNDLDPQQIAQLLSLTINHGFMLSMYNPPVFEGDLTLIYADGNEDLCSQWDAYVHGRVRRSPLACEHMQMLSRRFVGAVAGVVDRQLAEITSATDSAGAESSLSIS